MRSTELLEARDLEGTHGWFESAYEWSIVTMATVVRCQLSAQHHKTVLFVIHAEDELVNAIEASHSHPPSCKPGEFQERITLEVLQHPNMNDTGCLPGFGMFHIGQLIRFTHTVEVGLISVDQTGVVVGLDFHEHEVVENKEALKSLDKP